MNKQIERIQEWIIQRDTRERIALFLVSLLVIYFFWNLIFIKPVIRSQLRLKEQINQTKSSRETIQQQYTTIINIVNSPEFSSLMIQEKQLSLRSETAKHQITGFTPIFVSEVDYSKLTKDILAQLDKTIVLVSLKEFPDQHWNAPEIDKSVISVKNVYQHKLAIEFRANYFDTMAYLTRLESLPWHIYWDSFEYKVMTYPEADVIVQFYVLSIQANA